MPFQDRDQAPKRIYLGKITKAHGVKGLVKIQMVAEDPRLLETADAVYSAPLGGQHLKITLKNSDGKDWLATIEGIKDRDQAELMGGTPLYIDRDQLPEIKTPGQYYYEDLKGLRVIENEQDIGRVLSVDNFGAGDLVEIQPTTGQSFYLPFNPDFVISVNLETGTLSVQNSDQMKIV
jgi:16S rRNA processing protein RimM